MVQQVNLYSALTPDLDGPPSAVQIVQICAGALALTVLVAAYSMISSGARDAELAALETTQEDLKTEVATLKKKYGVKDKDPALIKEIEALKREQESKTILLSGLSSQSAASKEGFSSALRGLARQRVHGLWLSEIHLSDGGTELALSGSSLRPEYVPQLLQLLRQEPAFQGREFSRFALNRGEETSGAISFSMSSSVEGDKK